MKRIIGLVLLLIVVVCTACTRVNVSSDNSTINEQPQTQNSRGLIIALLDNKSISANGQTTVYMTFIPEDTTIGKINCFKSFWSQKDSEEFYSNLIVGQKYYIETKESHLQSINKY